MSAKRLCVCGQGFSSIGELERHERSCETLKRHETTERLVTPLRKNAAMLQTGLSAIHSYVATSFGSLAVGDLADATYMLELAERGVEENIPHLKFLAEGTAEVSRNRFAVTDLLQREVRELAESYGRWETIVRNIRSFLRRLG